MVAAFRCADLQKRNAALCWLILLLVLVFLSRSSWQVSHCIIPANEGVPTDPVPSRRIHRLWYAQAYIGSLPSRSRLLRSGHRYDIYEQVGCYPYIYNTPLTFPLVLVWPIIIGLCSAVYCGEWSCLCRDAII